MSTLPGRTGAIALSLSFAATFGLVIALANTAADLAAVPESSSPQVRPVPPPTVYPMMQHGIVVDAEGVSINGRRVATADEVLADSTLLVDALGPQTSGTTVRVRSDGKREVVMEVVNAALEAGHVSVTILADEAQRPHLAL